MGIETSHIHHTENFTEPVRTPAKKEEANAADGKLNIGNDSVKISPVKSDDINKANDINNVAQPKVTHQFKSPVPSHLSSVSLFTRIAHLFKKSSVPAQQKSENFLEKHQFQANPNHNSIDMADNKYTYQLLVNANGKQLLKETKSIGEEKVVRYFEPKNALGKGGFGSVQKWKEI